MYWYEWPWRDHWQKSIYFVVKSDECIAVRFFFRFTNEMANRHYSNSVCLCPYLYFIDSHNINWIWITVHAYRIWLTSPIVWPLAFAKLSRRRIEKIYATESTIEDALRLHNRIGPVPLGSVRMKRCLTRWRALKTANWIKLHIFSFSVARLEPSSATAALEWRFDFILFIFFFCRRCRCRHNSAIMICPHWQCIEELAHILRTAAPSWYKTLSSNDSTNQKLVHLSARVYDLVGCFFHSCFLFSYWITWSGHWDDDFEFCSTKRSVRLRCNQLK